MKSKLLILFLSTVSAATAFSACGKTGQQREVSFEDVAKQTAPGEVVINNTDIEEANAQPIRPNASVTENNKVLPDKSTIITMHDGQGNTTETRYFDNHPLLKFILIRTAADGTKQAFAYGYGNETKLLASEFSEKALTASADELAGAVDLKNARAFNYKKVRNFMQRTATVQPPPTNQYQAQPEVIPPTQESPSQSDASQTEAPPRETSTPSTPVSESNFQNQFSLRPNL